ncbi:MAG: ATP-binding protein [Sandaracinus sp.]|nr:ATP-binding protein [Myxococcales bacterium]MCB9617132.1 ATP-binding protein [Sandaracinus sp.]
MASPYRGGASAPSEGAVENDGLVDDLVKQFADPYAFLRELVQNSIDAGSTAIFARVEAIGDGVRISVRDRGEGMDPDVIENRLLVLFRSGKEGQEGKIGKFGVGFVSVLALSPKRVTVTTTKGKGRTWTLHLFSDHSYELFESAGGSQAGTSVAIEVEGLTLDEAAKRSGDALRHWCRHAQVPIQLQIDGKPDERIDSPFEKLEGALVSLHVEEDGTRVVVGMMPNGLSQASFFNHGLTLAETRLGDAFEGLVLKVLDSRLSHTLSRDDVRRDAAFSRAMRNVQRVIDAHFRDAVERALREAAEKPDPKRYAMLFERSTGARSRLVFRRAEVPVRLLHAKQGAVVCSFGATRDAVAATKPSALTEAFAKEGMDVVDANLGSHVSGGSEAFRAFLGLTDASQEGSLVTPVEPTSSDLVLLDRLRVLLDRATRPPKQLRFVTVVGRDDTKIAYGGKALEGPTLIRGGLDADPFRLLRRPAELWVHARTLLVRQARDLAPSDPELAAQLLARAILLAHARLDDDACHTLAEASLATILGGAR